MSDTFSEDLMVWYDATKRDLPWRHTHDPYAIWVSEVMLQQTRALTVIGYYARFMEQFPTVDALANAPEQAVLKAWEGLGYYSRARNLQRGAQAVVERHDGVMPREVEQLLALPGIGPYTAGAVASIAFGVRTPAVDGNVERVVTRVRGIREDVGIPSVARKIREEALALMPNERVGDHNQAMMELGARVCSPGTPDCEVCPVRVHCDAFEAGDADLLPQKQRKTPPRPETHAVAIVRCGDRVWVRMRTARLLGGLWEFPMFPEVDTAETAVAALAEQGIDISLAHDFGEARHVFTHLVWNMRLFGLTVSDEACIPQAHWVDATALQALPWPTALRVARDKALEWLAEPCCQTF